MEQICDIVFENIVLCHNEINDLSHLKTYHLLKEYQIFKTPKILLR